MVTIGSSIEAPRSPKLDVIGRTAEGVEVKCLVVRPENVVRNGIVIQPGHTARPSNYYEYQLALASEFGIASWCVERPDHIPPSERLHLNRACAKVLDVAIRYAREENGGDVDTVAHSWGGSNFASRQNYDPRGVRLFVGLGIAGQHSALGKVLTNPIETMRRGRHDLSLIAKHLMHHPVRSVGHIAEAVSHAPLRIAQVVVASEHHNLAEHLENRDKSVLGQIAIWFGDDCFFDPDRAMRSGATIFDEQHVLPGRPHTMPQSHPNEMAEITVQVIDDFMARRTG